ncbi:MAG TPA: N-acetyltransferase, partial [Pedococcus sp.]
MTDPVDVRPMRAEDWPQVEAIYRAGIATGHATFESEPPTWEAFDASRLPDHRHVA